MQPERHQPPPSDSRKGPAARHCSQFFTLIRVLSLPVCNMSFPVLLSEWWELWLLNIHQSSWFVHLCACVGGTEAAAVQVWSGVARAGRGHRDGG